MPKTASPAPAIVWFRDDLRLADNPALAAACRDGRPVVLVYLLDEESAGIRPHGGAARWWLHHSLAALSGELATSGQTLVLKQGEAAKIIPKLARSLRAVRVYWNRRYGPAKAVDDAVTAALARSRIGVDTFAANFLFEPGTVINEAGEPCQAFADFWHVANAGGDPRRPLPIPHKIEPGPAVADSVPLHALGLLPKGPDWAHDIRDTWHPGERGAMTNLDRFVWHLADYAERDTPSVNATSMLSPHLRFGEVSPFQVWHAVANAPPEAVEVRDKFLSELGRREFAWHLLAARPDLATANLKPAYDRFAWGEAYAEEMWAWRRGRTGYPIVDAGMRQLWQKGWMHNRVRMIVASFLVKHLLVDWRIGEEWFWDTLVDADGASNPVNWQWVAGSGVDAQPFFHVFNPVLQGEKFDPDGTYVRRYVPELARLPSRYIHKPWMASSAILTEAGVFLRRDYPSPIVDHAEARERALGAFARMKEAG